MDIAQFDGPYAFLSNFYTHSQRGPGRLVYPTLEHAFQASKTRSPEQRAWIQSALTPAEAKRRGRAVEMRPDWEGIKVDVMYDLLKVKFEDAKLARQLISTEPMNLVEGNWWGDTFWGAVRHTPDTNESGFEGWYGRNYLGRLLVRVRHELQGHEGCTCRGFAERHNPPGTHPVECPVRPTPFHELVVA